MSGGNSSLAEPAATIFAERTIIVEEIFNGCGWGVMFVLYWQSMQVILRRRKDFFLGIHATALFTVGTFYLIGCMILTGKIFIDHRMVPGGPVAALTMVYSQPIVMLANASFPLQSWLADGLIIYRCLVIYSFNYWVIAFPALLLLGSICTAATLLGFEAHPNIGFWSPISVKLAVPYFSLSISLNIIVTTLICLRLWYYRKTITAALGKEHAKHYTSVSAMLVESAALNTICSLVFLVPYARGNAVSNIFQGLVCYCQITASMLIVLRVVRGQAFSKGTIQTTYPPMSALEFNSPSHSRSMVAKKTVTSGFTTDTTTTNNASRTSAPANALASRDIQIQLSTHDAGSIKDDYSGGSSAGGASVAGMKIGGGEKEGKEEIVEVESDKESKASLKEA